MLGLIFAAFRNGDLDVMNSEQFHSFANFEPIRSSTNAGTRPDDPSAELDTCFIRLDDTNEYSSAAVRKTVSIFGCRRRFIIAIRNSYS